MRAKISLFFILVPYFTVLQTPFSLQPYAVVFSLVLFWKDIWAFKYNTMNILPLSSLIFSIALFPTGDSLNSLRSIFNYISYLLIFIVTISIMNKKVYIIDTVVKFCLILYIIFAVLQISFFPLIASCCVSNISSQLDLIASGRGVSSLTPEPTFFGFILVMFLCYFIENKHYTYVSICLIGLFLLSQSTLAILCLGLAYLIEKASFLYRIKNVLALASLVSVVIVFFSNFELNNRFFLLTKILIFDGPNALMTDASGAGRMYHIVQPFLSFWDNYGVPHGYGGLPNGDPRILSGIGATIYELGYIGLPLLVHIVWNLLRIYKNTGRLIYPLFIFFAWLNANQIGLPILIFVMTYLSFKKHGGCDNVPHRSIDLRN